jgi:hypothetical protein
VWLYSSFIWSTYVLESEDCTSQFKYLLYWLFRKIRRHWWNTCPVKLVEKQWSVDFNHRNILNVRIKSDLKSILNYRNNTIENTFECHLFTLLCNRLTIYSEHNEWKCIYWVVLRLENYIWAWLWCFNNKYLIANVFILIIWASNNCRIKNSHQLDSFRLFENRIFCKSAFYLIHFCEIACSLIDANVEMHI